MSDGKTVMSHDDNVDGQAPDEASISTQVRGRRQRTDRSPREHTRRNERPAKSRVTNTATGTSPTRSFDRTADTHSHLKYEFPHLMTITDPAILAAELERVRAIYNGVRLHEAIGYVTPNDEHEGRGDKIRAARADGMRIADEQRRATHRAHRNQP